MALCQYCKAIPFHDLPNESEDGIPHQPHLPALQRSAQTCSMCELLCHAAFRTRAMIVQEACGGNGMPTGWVSWENKNSARHIPGKPFLTHHYGQYMSNSTRATGGVGIARPDGSPEYPFIKDSRMKCYLYGNWYNSLEAAAQGSGKEALQLIGVGMRLGTSPKIEDGEGNSLEESHCRGTALRVRSMEDQKSSDFIPTRPKSAWLGSSFTLERAKAWLKHCDDHHRSCPQHVPALPRRILWITGGPRKDVVVLLDAAGGSAKYAALSHCWGGNLEAKTTKSNLANQRRGIAWNWLPRTFQEAITFTRRLGLDFIWIDALCIVQDDAEETAQEIPAMAKVYSKAYVTLSATHSSSSHSGLFTPHVQERIFNEPSVDNRSLWTNIEGITDPFIEEGPEPDMESRFVSMGGVTSCPYPYRGEWSNVLISPEWMPPSTTSHRLSYYVGGFGRPFDPLENQPLHSRGWVVQERLLSLRVIYFASDQMYWHCRRTFCGEDGSQCLPFASSVVSLIQGQKLPLSKCGQPVDEGMLSLIEGWKPFERESRGRWQGGWLKHVEEYSSRSFSYESDRLPALSGLALALQQYTNDEYHAGLWRSYMIEDLAWRTYPVDEDRKLVSGGFGHVYGSRHCTMMRASPYRAPSWSWASVVGRIRFIPVDHSRCVAEVLDVKCKPQTPLNPLGNLSSASLKIRGPLLRIERAGPHTKWSKELPLGFGIVCKMQTSYGESLGEVYFDLETFPSREAHISVSGLAGQFESMTVSNPSPSRRKSSLSGFARKFGRSTNKDAPQSSRDLSADKKQEGTSKDAPLFGLFLDSSVCLVLLARSKTSPNPREFERVGVGNFLRTKLQIGEPDPTKFAAGDSVPFGPITSEMPRTEVSVY